MDDLRKIHEKLKNKPEYELDAFEQEALEGLGKTDLNKASSTKVYYDTKFLSKYRAKKNIIRIIYLSAAALLLVTFSVWLWKYYNLNESNNQLLSSRTEKASMDINQIQNITQISEENSSNEFKIQKRQDILSNLKEKNSEIKKESVIKNQSKKNGTEAFPKNIMISDEHHASSSDKMLLNNNSTSTFSQHSLEDQEQRTNEISNSSDFAQADPSLQRPMMHSAPSKSLLKISGDVNIFENIDHLINELKLFSDKNMLNLTEIIVKDKKLITIYVKGFKFDEQTEALKKDFENIIRKNLKKEWKDKNILTKGN